MSQPTPLITRPTHDAGSELDVIPGAPTLADVMTFVPPPGCGPPASPPAEQGVEQALAGLGLGLTSGDSGHTSHTSHTPPVPTLSTPGQLGAQPGSGGGSSGGVGSGVGGSVGSGAGGGCSSSVPWARLRPSSNVSDIGSMLSDLCSADGMVDFSLWSTEGRLLLGR